MPTRAKGRKYPVEISGVAWLDLLGYGALLRPVLFDPTHKQAQEAVFRLNLFQEAVVKHSMRHITAMIINDGVAYVRELSPRSRSVTFDFILRMHEAFLEINQIDQNLGFPGARMVVATGPRMRMDHAQKLRNDLLKTILQKAETGEISTKQAIHEAFRSLPVAGSFPELQANFAFTKAYLADSSGSKAGLAGPNFFIDSNFFKSQLPGWVEYSEIINWETPGMFAKFLKVKNFNRKLANQLQHEGVNNALEISGNLISKY